MRVPVNDLPTTLRGLVEQAPQVQLLLDEAWSAQASLPAEAFAPFAGGAPELAAALRKAIAPSRLRVQRFDLDLRCGLAWDRGAEVALRVRPLNLGFELAYGASGSSACRLQVQVVQFAPPPFTPTELST